MASSKKNLKPRMATLRHTILSYKPGKDVPLDDERVVFPEKLVIGMIDLCGREPGIVHTMRHALRGVEQPSKPDDERQTSTANQEEYLTDYVSVITKTDCVLPLAFKEAVQYLAGKVVFMVLFMYPVNIEYYQGWIEMMKEITGRRPLCAMFPTGDIQKARNELKQHGITDIYEVAVPHILSDKYQLQWLELLHECIREGDKALVINELVKKICTNPRETTLRQEIEELKNEREEFRARSVMEKSQIELSWKKENDQLESMIQKLRTKIQRDSEIRSSELKHETYQWSFFSWFTFGKQAQGGTSSFEDNSTGFLGLSDTLQEREEPPDDEFADILQKIAGDLYEEAKIDSLGGQLGILHGDIERALMTNVKFNRVTSDGTRHMLKQWRRGVSREDERIELKKALQSANLVDLADQYLNEATERNTAGYLNEDVDDKQPSTRDDTSLEQVRTQGDLTDGRRSPRPDKLLKRSTDYFDASEMTSEDVSSEVVHAGDDMTNVSSIQPSEKSSSHEMQVPPKDMSEIAPMVPSGGKPNEESTTSDKRHVGGIISNEEDLISQLVLIDTSPEKILILLLIKIIIEFPRKDSDYEE